MARAASTATSDEPASVIANEELSKLLDEELARLPVKLNAAVILCDLEGLSQKEAARQLGIAPSTVNYHVAKARKILRERLVRRGLTIGLGGLATFGAASREPAAAMSESIVADITAKASLYAAGKSASEAGVSSTVFELATGISSAMTKAKLLTVLFTAVAFLAFAGSLAGLIGLQLNTVQAGTIFLDDFNDGDYADGSPITWEVSPFQFGDADASSGDLVVSPNAETVQRLGFGVGTENSPELWSRDMSIRSQVRITKVGGTAFLNARIQSMGEDPVGYTAAVGYSPANGTILAVVRNDGAGKSQSLGPLARLPFDVRETDAVIQLDVIDDVILGWAWQAGDAMPDTPQIVATDSTYSEPGFTGVGFVNILGPNGNSQSTFRYVHVANMPIHEIVLDTPGDFDGNGNLDTVDIDLLNEQIKIGGHHSLFDLNGDGRVTEEDRLVWVQDLAGTFLGDANLDSRVDAADLNALALNWQDSVASWAGGDFTGDGLVNSADLNVLALNWQNAANAVAAVPEPSSLLLLSVLFGSSFFLVRNNVVNDY